MSFKDLHTTSEVLQVIRVLVDQSTKFTPHIVHVFVRLPKRQMRDLKMCQLQVRHPPYSPTRKTSTLDLISDQGLGDLRQGVSLALR